MKADMVPDSGIAAGTVSRRDWTALLALALVLRLVAAWQESVLHPDEVFQYLEGAFRLLHGYSVVTWEYRDGMRGDLYPALLALPMRLGEWIAPDGSLTIWLPRMMMAILSLSIVAAAGAIGARVSRLHFWTAGLIAACWPDLVAFAPHPLTEQMAALLAAPAIALLGLPGRSARQLMIIGAAVGLAVVFRPHVAPALALGLLVHVWRAGPRSLWPLVAGGLVGLAIGAVSDVAGGHWPFEWLVHNVDRNIVDNVSARYGVSGPFQYAVDLLALWGLWTAPILVLAALGARRYPLLAVVAIANILVHSAIGHKEYRFVILSVTAIIFLAGVGTGDAIAELRAQRGRQAWRVALVLGAGWLAAAAHVAPALHDWGERVVTPFSAAASDGLRAKPGLCGMAVVGNRFFRVYGYARLQRRVPIFVQAPGDPHVDPAQFNAALVWKGHADALTPDFRAAICSADGSQCLYERKGGCSAATSRAEINRYLADRGM